MSHNTSGLPKLDLEPFDPSPLYAAAGSQRRNRDQPHYTPSRRPLLRLVFAVLPLAGAAGTVGYFLS